MRTKSLEELAKKVAMPAADAVAWADWETWAEKSLEEFAAEVIRLADAERGKEAVAIYKAMLDAAQGERNADKS